MFKKYSEDINLFLISFLILFLEIAIVRWISTEIRIFAYLNNLVLLACFLGIGLGCYFSDRKVCLSLSISMLSVLIMFVNLPFTVLIKDEFFHIFRDIPFFLTAFTDSVVWYETTITSNFFTTILGILSTLVIFFVVVFIFMPLGQVLGRAMSDYKETIRAYSLNIIASILGIAYFSRISFLYTPPWFWFMLALGVFAIIFLLSTQERNLQNLASVLICLMLIIATMMISPPIKFGRIIVWSPYQKLEFHSLIDREKNIQKGYIIDVNNVGYMTLLSHEYTGELSQYDIPYRFKKDIGNLLILGAGAGNDAAGALRNKVKYIDAVEIDPGIYKLGAKFHPEDPYSNPKVNVVIDDARSFLKKANKKYDMVCFGLLDSHILSSSYNNMRLDHYVYTRESIEEARGLLKKDGVLTLTFWVQRDWIGKRLHDLLKEVFKAEPLVFSMEDANDGFGITMFVTGNNMPQILKNIKGDEKLAQFIDKKKVNYHGNPKLTTDDWPYLYLEKPGMPRMHISVLIVLLALFIVAGKAMLPKGLGLDLHFLFLGAGFLLLEFQNISKSALLFGSTWLVNTFTISAILVLGLLANIFVSKFEIRNLKLIYGLLILSLAVTFLIPLRMYNFLGFWQKSIIVSLILNLPVFFAGIIFITSLKKSSHKNLALGSNFIGAALGGILESLSFITGISALVLVCLALYLVSFIFMDNNRQL